MNERESDKLHIKQNWRRMSGEEIKQRLKDYFKKHAHADVIVPEYKLFNGDLDSCPAMTNTLKNVRL